ncbi:ABC transporter permease subunit [Streptomyces sp. LX-29]|uniref:ABC transporter permease subunit n=1 Tax=Streptomyces sp. LX-29 TaxID=2900152 RepID=UPI00240DCE92|nr:ABC transporter permease subunit [Streptomyces sp. LX-29]WFB06207.1 ABC transporter permease subunit [Streptomyces sp. LX-29]
MSQDTREQVLTHPTDHLGESRAGRASIRAVVHSEWMKVRTLRSLPLALVGGLAATVGGTMLACGTYGEAELEAADFDPVFASFFGLNFGQIAAICFGVLAVAGEYADGGIRVWLAAVPRRGLWYGGKLAVVGGLSLATGLVTGFVALLGGQALLGEHGVGLGAPGALRAALGCGLYLTLLTLLAAGVAAALRSTVGAIGVLVPVVCFLSPVLGEGATTRFLPDRAGQQVLHAAPEGGLGAWSGLGVLALWTAAAVWAGWRVLERRDA